MLTLRCRRRKLKMLLRAVSLVVVLLAPGCLQMQASTRRGVLSSVAAVSCLSPHLASAKAGFLRDVPLESLEETASQFDNPEEEVIVPKVANSPVARAQERALTSPANKKRATVTETVRLNVRVSRSDGTFAVRDDDEDRPFFGALDVGLFGEAAPANVALFLEFALNSPMRDDFSYSRSVFDEKAENGALAIGGRVRGVEERSLFQGLERILVYRDKELLSSKRERKIASLAAKEGPTFRSHDAPGLLTRRRGATGTDLIDFGLTLRAAPELDANWVVFGKLTNDNDEGLALIDRIASLPTYSDEAITDSALAAQVFRAQKETFRNVATAIGDSRVSSVFRGKILRRVEITQSSLIAS